jgi:putative hemolysin
MSTHSRILALVLLMAPTACSKPEPTQPPPTQIANPASEHCVKQGGTLEIVDTPEGQQGICTLPDGTRCEEWAYMRGECPCGECPQLSPPAPGFCEGGTIVAGAVDACGCQGPPTCQKAAVP